MSRPFESYETANRSWDIRVLENISARKLFLMLLALVFVAGASSFVVLYEAIRNHRFDSSFFPLVVCGSLAFRYSRLIYRRLDQQ